MVVTATHYLSPPPTSPPGITELRVELHLVSDGEGGSQLGNT